MSKNFKVDDRVKIINCDDIMNGLFGTVVGTYNVDTIQFNIILFDEIVLNQKACVLVSGCLEKIEQ